MDGVINVLKPPGMTSFDVIGFLRSVVKQKKIGHTGTLDPGAAGVLPVCLGKATGAIEYITGKDKVYRAELTLGVETDTQDSYGKITSQKEVNATETSIIETIDGFKGIQFQIPPMYSAVKVNGKKLYELAREGLEIERKPREIIIYSTNIIDIKREKIIFDVHCSKGTYIRTLCTDIGRALGCGGHMSFLIRLAAGPYKLEDSVTLEEIADLQREEKLTRVLAGLDCLFNDYRRLNFNEAEVQKLKNGCFLNCPAALDQEEILSLYDDKGRFFALGEIVSREKRNYIKVKKSFY